MQAKYTGWFFGTFPLTKQVSLWLFNKCKFEILSWKLKKNWHFGEVVWANEWANRPAKFQVEQDQNNNISFTKNIIYCWLPVLSVVYSLGYTVINYLSCLCSFFPAAANFSFNTSAIIDLFSLQELLTLLINMHL